MAWRQPSLKTLSKGGSPGHLRMALSIVGTPAAPGLHPYYNPF